MQRSNPKTKFFEPSKFFRIAPRDLDAAATMLYLAPHHTGLNELVPGPGEMRMGETIDLCTLGDIKLYRCQSDGFPSGLVSDEANSAIVAEVVRIFSE